ncbi:hypothetical protein F2P81_023657 [Scophthalmus maximus]|uniref:Uncharacterized protein n=1 Tax=Scophthalmus maximus TaxID=52904 RepID=A0A6A4RXK2_SCOMX|nr:hypothetical protein F2P81_023657 [Scophthalmus maximus]
MRRIWCAHLGPTWLRPDKRRTPTLKRCGSRCRRRKRRFLPRVRHDLQPECRSADTLWVTTPPPTSADPPTPPLNTSRHRRVNVGTV